MAEVFLGLGSNEGDREENIKAALSLLSDDDHCRIDAVSSLYDSKAVGENDQPDFLNCVIRITTGYSPDDLLELAKSIEKEMGRSMHSHMLPRTIDIDILLYDDMDIDSINLRIPHSRLCLRRFVLEPLLEIDATLIHPVTNMPLSAYLEDVKSQEMVKYLDSTEVWNEQR